MTEHVRVAGRCMGEQIAARQAGDWTVKLALAEVLHPGPRPPQSLRSAQPHVQWRIIATHPQREPMMFTYEGEAAARRAFQLGSEAELYEAACIGKVLS